MASSYRIFILSIWKDKPAQTVCSRGGGGGGRGARGIGAGGSYKTVAVLRSKNSDEQKKLPRADNHEME